MTQSPGLDETQIASTHTGQETARTPLGLPAKIGRFEVLRQLGEGGMGTVMLATDPLLGRDVALKVLRAGSANSSDAQRRLMREAQGTAKISHENVIVVHEVGSHDGHIFIAMEYVAGGTLKTWQVERGWRAVFEAYLRAGRGLVAAHDAGLVHRDFKPDNVLVGDDGRLRVSDFGLVAMGDAVAEPTADPVSEPVEVDGRLTLTGVVLGTPRYMPPEQFRGAQVDARADQFAFCAALYEALYGRPAFAGATVAELARRIVAGEVQPVPADSPVPAGVHDALLRGLAPDRDARFPTLRELLVTLSVAASSSERRSARKRWPAVLGALVVLGAVSAGVVYVARESKPVSAPAAAAETKRRGGSARSNIPPLRRVQMSFDNGRAAFEAGSFVEAAEAFEDAYAAWPIPELLFNAAASYQALARSEEAPFGAYAMAVARYRQFLGVRPKDMGAVEAIVAGLEGDIARVAGGEQAAARSSIPALRGAVIVQSVPGGATLYLDDRSNGPLGTTPWSGPVEGAHRIIGEKAGYTAFETDIAPLPGALVVVTGRLGTP